MADRPNTGILQPSSPSYPTKIAALLTHLVGETVSVTCRDGCRLEGILDPDTTRSTTSIVLSLPCQLFPKPKVLGEKVISLAIGDVCAINCLGLVGCASSSTSFSTDAAISHKNACSTSTTHRELRPWAPDVGTNPLSEQFELAGSSTKWDQFAANERLFGITTSFDELAYTTPLDRTASDFREREEKAARLASDIQTTTSKNIHMAEERSGSILKTENDDEEELYGAVIRATPNTPPGFASSTIDNDDIVKLPKALVPEEENAKFENDRLRVFQEFTRAQQQLESESPIEVPHSLKSKLNPAAAEFVPSSETCYGAAEAGSDAYYYNYPNYAHSGSTSNTNHYYNNSCQQSLYMYYYDEYGNCYFYTQPQQ